MKENLTDKMLRFSSSMKEEQFMYLSIITALLSYNAQIYWLAWIFGLKGLTEFFYSVYLAFAENKRLR
jgi:hypothetical protein